MKLTLRLYLPIPYCSSHNQSDSEDDIPLPPSMGGALSQSQSVSHLSERVPLGLPTEASIMTSATNERRLTHRRDHGVQSRLADGNRGSEIYFVGKSVIKPACLPACLVEGKESYVMSYTVLYCTTLYTHIGIIDILQQYNAFKRAETFFKSFKYDSRQISAVDPRWYAHRFVNFVREQTT